MINKPRKRTKYQKEYTDTCKKVLDMVHKLLLVIRENKDRSIKKEVLDIIKETASKLEQ